MALYAPETAIKATGRVISFDPPVKRTSLLGRTRWVRFEVHWHATPPGRDFFKEFGPQHPYSAALSTLGRISVEVNCTLGDLSTNHPHRSDGGTRYRVTGDISVSKFHTGVGRQRIAKGAESLERPMSGGPCELTNSLLRSSMAVDQLFPHTRIEGVRHRPTALATLKSAKEVPIVEGARRAHAGAKK